MANSFDSNITRKLARVFLEKFETERVITKNVDTQLLQGKFNPSSGDTVDFKRPTDYTSTRTSAGDISGSSPDDITTGKASGTVQNYFTVWVDYNEADEAIKMDQLDQLLAPMATRIVTDLETDFAAFMLKYSGLYSGTISNAVDAWSDVANVSALMKSVGIPEMDWCMAVNPYTQAGLASQTNSLGAGGVAGQLVKSAHEKGVIADNYAGLKVVTSTALASITADSEADRAGAVNGTMDVTYATHKDTMLQTITVDALSGGVADTDLTAGERITIAGVNMLNQSTRAAIKTAAGAAVPWVGCVASDVTLTNGAGNITVSNPAIYESGGAYNTVDAAMADDAVVNVLGAASATFQPNLFWQKSAFALGSVPIKKLHSTDTIATTEDGLQFRVSKYSDGDKNQQTVRIDFRPAYASLNPYFAGHGWGAA